MAREYFLARDENGLHLFGSKPRLRRKIVNPIHWEWVDGEGRHGWPIMNCKGTQIIFDKYHLIHIKFIDFEEDCVFSPLRKIEHEHNINNT